MSDIKYLIDKYNFRFKKYYGQNFIADQNILNNIVSSSLVDDETLVIEIGVGAGALTSKIAEKAKQVLGYEIDNNLEPILSETLKNYNNIEIIYDDFLKRDISKDVIKYEYQKLYVIANLPYYITTPILSKIIEEKVNVEKTVVMVQKEVGDRINAKPNSKEYNSLTIFLNYYFNIKKLFNVSRNVFVPKPNVDSVVIELSRKQRNEDVLDETIFFKLVRDSFRYKRKTLRNNLKEYNLDVIEKALLQYNLNLTVRAEQLSLKQFADISNAIKLSK